MTRAVLALGVAIGLTVPRWAIAGVTTRASLSGLGLEAAGGSSQPALSVDGRLVAFVSAAGNLVPGDTNGYADVFLRDRALGTTQLVSVSSAGAQGDRDSGAPYNNYGPALSADGRFVAFYSQATNLVAGDTNGRGDVFVRDLVAGGTVLVSRGVGGIPADGTSRGAALSADGRFVAFTSDASNLVAGDANGVDDVFVHDRDADGNGVFDEAGGTATTRVSVGPGGIEGDAWSGYALPTYISADGRVVSFVSAATNLVVGDTNDALDVFVHDRETATTSRVSVSSFGGETFYQDSFGGALSADGRFVVFDTPDRGVVPGRDQAYYSDVFVHDRLTGTSVPWSVDADGIFGGRWSLGAGFISGDGRYVALLATFGGGSLGNPPIDVFVYVHDRTTGATVSFPLNEDALAGVGSNGGLALSANGRVIAFESESAALVAGDGNRVADVFTHDCPVPSADDTNLVDCEPVPFARLVGGDAARFAAGRREFAKVDTVADGLGPVFNGASCAECHNRPYVGGSSARTVRRVGTSGSGTYDPLVVLGGPVIQEHGIDALTCQVAGEVIPAEATVVTARDTPALFGVGLIDALTESRILRNTDPDDRNHDGISGRPNRVGGRLGRFGRKAQIASLQEFAGDAYLNEMGITSPAFPTELAPQGAAPICDPVPDPEDDGRNVVAFTDFLTLLAPLPSGQYPSATVRLQAKSGRRVFKSLGCRACHVENLRAGSSPTPALAMRRVPLFSDLLLHDLGADLADGVEQGEATGSEFRTAPLWGVAWSAPYLHDGRAPTLAAAIAAHGGEAERARDRFLALSGPSREALLAFLRSL